MTYRVTISRRLAAWTSKEVCEVSAPTIGKALAPLLRDPKLTGASIYVEALNVAPKGAQTR